MGVFAPHVPIAWEPGNLPHHLHKITFLAHAPASPPLNSAPNPLRVEGTIPDNMLSSFPKIVGEGMLSKYFWRVQYYYFSSKKKEREIVIVATAFCLQRLKQNMHFALANILSIFWCIRAIIPQNYIFFNFYLSERNLKKLWVFQHPPV